MASRLSGVFLALVAAASTGSLLFAVQPPSGQRVGARVPTAGLQHHGEAYLPSAGDSEPAATALPAAESAAAVRSLALGLALGLAVGLAGAGLPSAARAAEEVKAPEDYDIRKGQSEAERKAWNAEKAKKWAVRQFSPEPDPKYNTPTTGAGRYKQFGMDAFSPIASIPDTDNGTYPLKQKPYSDPAIMALYQKWLDTGKVRQGAKYGNYYSPTSPYAYDPK